MPVLRRTALFLIFASAMVLHAKGGAIAHDPNAQEMDRSVKPGDDFYGYANGGWLRTVAIPAGQTVYDTRAQLVGRTSQRVRDLIQAAAAGEPVTGTSAQKVGDYYASFMDVDAIDAKGMTVLAGELTAISAIHNTASLSAYLGATLNSEVDGLTANADHVFGVFVNQGFEDSKRCMFHLQGGLGLPGRDAYLDPSPRAAALREKYREHIAAIMKLADIPASDAKAERVLALESRIARAHAPDADAADVFKQNNPWKRADFDGKAPGMDWRAYFKAAGVAEQLRTKVIVEAANGPTTTDAQPILDRRGIVVVPDILANAGGVTVSYFEWVQGLSSFFWDEATINRHLEIIMKKAFAEVHETALAYKTDMRTAAYIRGVSRVADATRIRGLFP